MYTIEYWRDGKGCQPVVEYAEKLKWSEQKKFLAAAKRIEQEGPSLKRPTADYLGGKTGLWELRIFQHRMLYTFAGKTAWMLHAFIKKTDEIPQREIDTAMKRKKEIQNEHA